MSQWSFTSDKEPFGQQCPMAALSQAIDMEGAPWLRHQFWQPAVCHFGKFGALDPICQGEILYDQQHAWTQADQAACCCDTS